MIGTVQVDSLSVADAWVFTPGSFADERGRLTEWFRADLLAQTAGRPLTLAQANHTISRQRVLRGIHFADVPPGQAKYVYCTQGAVLDVIVDVRVGSPTFAGSASVQLDETDRRAVFISEGLGHAFLVLTEQATVVYLMSAPYTPAAEHGVHPLDPALGIDWPGEHPPVLSAKDAAAPTLAEARAAGLLPDYAECRAAYQGR